MSIVLLGSTSGSCTLQEQAVAGTTTLTLPTFNGTVGLLVSGTAVASTSGTSIDFTSIPAGVRRVTVMFSGVSSSGTSGFLVRLGDSGGIETTGYVSSCSTVASSVSTSSSTVGFLMEYSNAANNISGQMIISNISGNLWVQSVSFTDGSQSLFGSGSKTTSATLDRVRITTTNGTDTFDAGTINILYE